MSKIKEHYQDADGNWLPEAEAILAKATAIANDRRQPERTLMPLDEVDDFFVDLFKGVE
jgi:hypothetical protein